MLEAAFPDLYTGWQLAFNVARPLVSGCPASIHILPTNFPSSVHCLVADWSNFVDLFGS